VVANEILIRSRKRDPSDLSFINGIGEEGLSLVCARSLGRRIRSQDKFRRHERCGAARASSRLARHYRHVQLIEATSGAPGVTMRAFGMFREFGGAVHGSTHNPSSSKS
jgi:hypothetical protein